VASLGKGRAFPWRLKTEGRGLEGSPLLFWGRKGTARAKKGVKKSIHI